MSLVHDHNNSNLDYPEGEFRKNQDFMDPCYPNLQRQQQNQLYASDLDRFQSNHTDFSDDLVTGCNDDYGSFLSPSPEMDSFFAKIMKEEEKEVVPGQNGYVNGSEIMGYRNLCLQSSGNSGGTLMISSFKVMNDGGFDNSIQVNQGSDNRSTLSGLMKQHSSPAGFLSNLTSENECSATRDFQDLGNKNDGNGQASSSKKRLYSHMNEQYHPTVPCSSVIPPQEIGSNFSNNSWNKASFNFSETTGGTHITFSGSETQNERTKNKLVHHLSLPTTSSERSTVEKFLHFQGTTVPCKMRAKRGFATHPRSLAERVRRNRISQRMRKLQDLFPEMNKQTNTADMLDLAVEQIKELQKQVETLRETRAKCRCSGK